MENKLSNLLDSKKTKEINEVGLIAGFFGYSHIESQKLEKIDFELTKNLQNTDKTILPEISSLLRMYFGEKMMALPQPLMLYCDRPFPGSKENKKSGRLESMIVSIGSSRSVAECLSIETAISILQKIGYKNLEIQVNSIGDKESISEFTKKINAYIRKNMASFPASLRQALKKDSMAILKEENPEWDKFTKECPKSIEFLSETSRVHFKEVLEFLEIIDVPYSIDHSLISNLDVGAETIFSIKSDGITLVSGYRLNRLPKKLGYKKDLPISVVVLSAKLKKQLKKHKNKSTQSKFYLVQFGPEAKLKSFLILKELYKANIQINHSITKDKLGGQISIAETSGAQYVLLIGQKEALENSVVIRDVSTRAQNIIPIGELATKLKEYKKNSLQ